MDNHDDLDELPAAEVKARFLARYRFFRELASKHDVNTREVDTISIEEMRDILRHKGGHVTQAATVPENKRASLASEASAALYRRSPEKFDLKSPERTKWSPPSDRDQRLFGGTRIEPAHITIWQVDGPGGLHNLSNPNKHGVHVEHEGGMWKETRDESVHKTTYVHPMEKGDGKGGKGVILERKAIRMPISAKPNIVTQGPGLTFPAKPGKDGTSGGNGSDVPAGKAPEETGKGKGTRSAKGASSSPTAEASPGGKGSKGVAKGRGKGSKGGK